MNKETAEPNNSTLNNYNQNHSAVICNTEENHLKREFCSLQFFI